MAKRSEAKVPSGIVVRPGTHAALLYGDPAAMAEALAFAAGAIERKGTAVFLSYARLNQRVSAQLRDLYGVDVRKALADETLVILDGAEDPGNLTTRIARTLETAHRHHRPARIVTSLGWGEPGWPDEDELLHFEAGFGKLCREHEAAALCLYDARQLAGSLLFDGALACHPVVCTRGDTVKNPFALAPASLQRELATRRRGEDRLKAWMS